MDNQDIHAHPDLQGLRKEPGFGPRAHWRARRDRKRLAKQWRDPDVLRKQRRRKWAAAGAMVLVPVAVIAVVTYWPELSGQPGDAAVNRTPPSTTPTNYIPDVAVQLDRPFVGTPAADWKNGIAGIRFPKPEATGDFSAKEVAKALKAVRKSLRTAYFNPKVIVDHDLDVYLDTLAPATWKHVRDEPAAWIVRIHQDYPLLPASPKAAGKVSVRAGERGELIIDARFSVAYAFDIESPSALLDALDIVAVVNTRDDYRYFRGPYWPSDALGVWPYDSEGFVFSINCDAYDDGHYLAPAYSDREYTYEEDTLTPEDHFDPNGPISQEENC